MRRRGPSPLRLGLCCQFAAEPIRFRTTTATAMLSLPTPARLARLADLCRANAEALLASLEFCASHGIGAFRISSPLAGWDGPRPQRHHDYIDPADFPERWLGWPLTVEVEAKAKELAVARLLAALQGK